MPQNTDRPVIGRPKFGEVKWMHGKKIILVSYNSNEMWWYVEVVPEGVAPKGPPQRGSLKWNTLRDEL